jgi:hypothetical protein
VKAGRLARLALAALALGAAPAGPSSGPDSSTTERFVALVRAATSRYHDRRRAVADGYRLIGRDFPGMGEHWVNVGLLFDGAYDPARPEFLSYVVVDGAPKLLGVAYGLPLLAGEAPPNEPAGRAAWHDHVGTLDEETLVPHHHHSGHGGHGPRLAMVHAWVWLDNPEGLFAADNWAIPFARLGLVPPAVPARTAGQALSLLSGGDAYVTEALARERHSDQATRACVEALARARAKVEARVHGRAPGAFGPAELEALGALWDGLWNEIAVILPPGQKDRLEASAVR